MKKVNFLCFLFLIFISEFSYSQIAISDKSAKPTIKAIPYDGSFMNFNSFYSTSDKEKMAGVVGEKITLIDGFFDVKDENGENVSFSLKDEFKNKTFDIIEYVDDYSPKLKIKNELGVFIYTPSNTDDYLFNRHLDYLNARFLNKVFVPLYNKASLTSFGGEKIEISGTKEYLVNDIKFSKLEMGYGIVFKINDSFECILDWGDHSSFGGELEKGWVELKGIGFLERKVILMEKEVFKKFVILNKPFVNTIRSESFKVGMTEKQCRYSWGMPNTIYNSLGFKVLIWGSGENSFKLYFKNDKLHSIR